MRLRLPRTSLCRDTHAHACPPPPPLFYHPTPFYLSQRAYNKMELEKYTNSLKGEAQETFAGMVRRRGRLSRPSTAVCRRVYWLYPVSLASDMRSLPPDLLRP